MMGFEWVDIVIVCIIGLSLLTGLFRGFVKELIALCVWVLAIWLGYHYAANLTPWLQNYIHNQSACTAAAFIIILFATLLAGGIVNAIFGFLLKRTGLGGTDRTLGMVFGLLRGVFIVALLMVAVKMTSLPYQEYAQNSLLYARFDPIVAWLYARLPDYITQIKQVEEEKLKTTESEIHEVYKVSV